MLLLMSNEGSFRDALVSALLALGREVETVAPRHEDPLGAALGCRAVIYVAPRDEHGATQDEPGIEAALAASRAPGVEVLVAVMPASGGDAELARLRRDGTPYVVLRAPVLLEELGASMDDDRRVLLVGSDETMRALGAEALARAVLEAVETEDQGLVTELGQHPVTAQDALSQSAVLAGRQVWVIALWPPLLAALRWVARRLRRTPPGARATCPRLALPPGDSAVEAA